MKIYSIIFTLFFLIKGFSELQAQEEATYFEVDYAYGSILKHKAVMGHLVRAHPELYSVSWYNTAANNSWKSAFNYYDWGVRLIHQRFNYEALGSVTALNYFNNYYLLNRNNKHQLTYETGLGLGFNTNPLDLESNNQNVAISSPVSFSVHMKINYKYPNIYKGVGFHTGLFFTHYSNSAVKVPNFGVNSVFLNLGLSYRPLYAQSNFYTDIEKTNIASQPIHYHIGMDFSMHEVQATLGAKPVVNLSTYVNKKLSRKHGIRLGFDFSASKAYKDYAEFRHHVFTEDSGRVLKDYKQIGVFTGYELHFNKWLFEMNVGYYLYNPLQKTPSLYQKTGFKYKIKDSKFSVGFAIKVHNFRADNTSLGVSYQLNDK